MNAPLAQFSMTRLLGSVIKQIVLAITQDAPTIIRGKEYTLEPGQHVILAGGSPGRHRKQIVITNEDVNTKAYLVNGPDGNVDPATSTEKLITLGIGESITLFTSGTVVLKNLSGTEIISTLQVLETYYV